MASVAQETLWLHDSNILIPLLAEGCYSHSFAVDYYQRVRSLTIIPFTTKHFVQEAYSGFQWALRNCSPRGVEGQLDYIREVISRAGYTENLFVDGFIRGAAEGRWQSFVEYAQALGYESISGVEKKLDEANIMQVQWPQFCGAAKEDEMVIAKISDEIRQERVRRDISRGEEQAKAEAEALHIIREIRKGTYGVNDQSFSRAYFVSTSRLLDSMYGASDGLLTWSPETLYRHLAFLLPRDVDAQNVFEAISTAYYASGINLIDDDAYHKYFLPDIAESRLKFERERQRYLAAMERDVKESAEFEKQFEQLPDLEKPRFVAQMGWRLARAAEEKARIEIVAARAEIRQLKEKLAAKQTERQRKERETRRIEAARVKNLKNSKHVRKRHLQAKKKRRKN